MDNLESIVRETLTESLQNGVTSVTLRANGNEKIKQTLELCLRESKLEGKVIVNENDEDNVLSLRSNTTLDLPSNFNGFFFFFFS